MSENLEARMGAIEGRMADLTESMKGLTEQLKTSNKNHEKVFNELVRSHKTSIPIWAVAAMFLILLLALAGKEFVEQYFGRDLIKQMVPYAETGRR